MNMPASWNWKLISPHLLPTQLGFLRPFQIQYAKKWFAFMLELHFLIADKFEYLCLCSFVICIYFSKWPIVGC